eukprot:GHVT01092642.1.p1 GENE.GHVT01092642.1~~GHVT01092642.1.p1  ORF type:complete len:111 (+),score=2.35 GHVT01092642.1:112-444(+)
MTTDARGRETQQLLQLEVYCFVFFLSTSTLLFLGVHSSSVEVYLALTLYQICVAIVAALCVFYNCSLLQDWDKFINVFNVFNILLKLEKPPQMKGTYQNKFHKPLGRIHK